MEVVQEIAHIHDALIQKLEEAGVSSNSTNVINNEMICVGIYSSPLNAEHAADILRSQKINPVIQQVMYNLDWLHEVCYIGVKRMDFQKTLDCFQAHAVASTDLNITQVLDNAKHFRRRFEKFGIFLAKLFNSFFVFLSVYILYKALLQGKPETILIFGAFFLLNIVLWFLLRKEST